MTKDRNFKIYQELMPNRVKEILVVSSAYDAFIMEEDGGLIEHVYMSYRGISLVNPPKFNLVTTVEEALSKMHKKFFDLIILMPRNIDVNVISFGKEAKTIIPNVPVVILAHNMRGLTQCASELPKKSIDKLFVWSGNRNVLWAIVKWVEDKWNVVPDTEKAHVRVVIFVEDSPYYYSSILPLLYETIVHQTQEVLDDGLNEEDRLMKLRARPKILLANNYEEAIELYKNFSDYILGIFSDFRYQRNNIIDADAGIYLLSEIKKKNPTVPTLMFSSEYTNRSKAAKVNAHFLDKNSPSLHHEIKNFFARSLGFGDFVFTLPDGEEVARAHNLVSMENILHSVPTESIAYHASIGQIFSNWFLARSEIKLAIHLRSRSYESFADADEIRHFLIESIKDARIRQRKGIVGIYRPTDFDPEYDFLKLGDGSMGGKARGLAFMAKSILKNLDMFNEFSNVQINVPKTLVITTDYYDEFMLKNSLAEFSRKEYSNEIVASRFLEGRLSKQLEEDLVLYLKKVKYPLAIRSSSLLEDSQSLPYAGLYSTYMLPNNHHDIKERARQLFRAIKLIYASVFYEAPKAFSRSSMHRTEEEKMAVIIQEIRGNKVGKLFYPTLSGTVQSYNFYPIHPSKPEEGCAQLALGLGRTVVEGGTAIRFSLKHPKVLPQFSSVNSTLLNSQKYFYALKMKSDPEEAIELWVSDSTFMAKRDVFDSRLDSEVKKVSSIYLKDEHKLTDSKMADGMPVVTFANILKYNFVPLPEILTHLIELGRDGLGCDVEMEFAMNLSDGKDGKKHEFLLLQVRPMVTQKVAGDKINQEDLKQALCYSKNALGRATEQDITDIIYVKPEKFSSNITLDIVTEIKGYNAQLEKEDRKYLLVGPGRWGSSDRMLGVPVSWNHISAVAGIVEVSLPDFKVDPSQGTHFFHNITSLGVVYFTVYDDKHEFLNWDWFKSVELESEKEYTAHVKLNNPIKILIDGHKSEGALFIDE